MSYTAELVNEAIAKLANAPAVFSASDVAAHADLANEDGAIGNALRQHCDEQAILLLGEPPHTSPPGNRYLGVRPALQWWVDSTIRRAKSGIACLTPPQLAREMALAFDTCQWNTVPASLLAVGRRHSMVANGYTPGTFVFPWATVLSANPQGIGPFSVLFTGELPDNDCSALSLDDAVAAALTRLDERDADVLQRRYGYFIQRGETLEQVGAHYGVTRERIRQIQKRALDKLSRPPCSLILWRGFANDFAQSGGSLLIPQSSLTPRRILMTDSIGLNTAGISRLNLHFIGTDDSVVPYLNTFRPIEAWLDTSEAEKTAQRRATLQFLSQHDGEQVAIAENEYRGKQVVKSQSRMLREALRTLGRAAHFQELAELCNQMFPENQTSIHNWHVALGRPESEARGIVWIGRKGTFGLTEHGYTRPSIHLDEGIALIVEDIFAKTQTPVTDDVVFNELSKQRRELNLNSVKMALSFNDRLESVGNGRYVPKGSAKGQPPESRLPVYDISAAFDAFTANADTK